MNILKIKDKVIHTNFLSGHKEIGEILLIAKITECCTETMVDKYVYYVRTTTGCELFFEQNLEKYKE